jgi:flagellar biosynthesis chaperone FliJ
MLFSQVISSGKSSLVETLDDLDQLAYNQFMSVLQATVQQQTSGLVIP